MNVSVLPPAAPEESPSARDKVNYGKQDQQRRAGG
jgi:hypothetical protein